MIILRRGNPPIISEETWERTQAELARRRASGGRAATPTGGTGALTHRVYCSQRGRRFHRRTKTRRHVSYKFWWCETATRGKGNPCHAPQVRETELRRVITCVLDLDEWDNDAVLEQVRTITTIPVKPLSLGHKHPPWHAGRSRRMRVYPLTGESSTPPTKRRWTTTPPTFS